MTDQSSAWNTFCDMSYQLGRMEDNTKVSKVVDKVLIRHRHPLHA
jgi:hypothetical protein